LPDFYIYAISSASDSIRIRPANGLLTISAENFFQRVSAIMTTYSEPYSRPLSEVITIPDPDLVPVLHHAQKGGTLQWRTETHNYPKFEIRFQGANPHDEEKDKILAGTDLKPVTIRLNIVGDYGYEVWHYRHDGTFKRHGTRKFRVSPCGDCPP
jgi:hypothetical protein